ncbi:MAG: hypothetical protein GTN90_12415, partial [Xanthomonadales bacterium]|nr:hypothetical protein [Xanthomonadales bacterium]
AKTDHNPHHMLERAFSLAAFCMRRLLERNLVTDRFRNTQLEMFEIQRTPGAWPDQRDPFICSTGGEIYSNFDMKKRTLTKWKPKMVADKFVHARYIAVHSGSIYLPDGLLVASDYQSKNSLFHMTAEEYDKLVRSFLDDRVRLESDWIDIETGKIHAKRG